MCTRGSALLAPPTAPVLVCLSFCFQPTGQRLLHHRHCGHVPKSPHQGQDAAVPPRPGAAARRGAARWLAAIAARAASLAKDRACGCAHDCGCRTWRGWRPSSRTRGCTRVGPEGAACVRAPPRGTRPHLRAPPAASWRPPNALASPLPGPPEQAWVTTQWRSWSSGSSATPAAGAAASGRAALQAWWCGAAATNSNDRPLRPSSRRLRRQVSSASCVMDDFET